MSRITGPATINRFSPELVSAFGELNVIEPTPVIMLKFPYNINTELVDTTTTGSGTVTQDTGKAVLQTTAASSSSAQLVSHAFARYSAGQGMMTRFTAVFTTGAASSQQEIGIGNANDGFFFGYDETSFGILRRVGGSDNWTPQSSFNIDTLAGGGPSGMTLDSTKGNVYQITYQWLGFGAICFFVEDDKQGFFNLCHRINYTNQNTVPSINNPSLPLSAKVTNTNNDTNIKLQTSSMAALVQGRNEAPTLDFSTSNGKTTVSTETNILTLKNPTTAFSAQENRVGVRLKYISMASDGTKDVEFKIIKDTALGGTPSFADIDAVNSALQVDTAGTTVTGGTDVVTFELAKNLSDTVFMEEYKIDLHPGETLTFSAASSLSADIEIGVGWKEFY